MPTITESFREPSAGAVNAMLSPDVSPCRTQPTGAYLPGTDHRIASMGFKRNTVEVVRDEILAAIEEVRTVARSEHDAQRKQAADWLGEQFTGVTDRGGLREAASNGLRLYGGMGSFADVGTAESAQAVDRLGTALRRGRS
jgi:hypothetical protein